MAGNMLYGPICVATQVKLMPFLLSIMNSLSDLFYGVVQRDVVFKCGNSYGDVD